MQHYKKSQFYHTKNIYKLKSIKNENIQFKYVQPDK